MGPCQGLGSTANSSFDVIWLPRENTSFLIRALQLDGHPSGKIVCDASAPSMVDLPCKPYVLASTSSFACNVFNSLLFAVLFFSLRSIAELSDFDFCTWDS